MRAAAGCAAAAAAAVILAACGGSAAPPPGNLRACQHYRTQAAAVHANAEPSAADVVRLAGWIAADDAQAVPGTALRRDLDALSAAMASALSGGSGAGGKGAASRVREDCAALGVTIPP